MPDQRLFMALRLFAALLTFTTPLTVLSRVPASPYYYCMDAARATRQLTLEQHLDSGTWAVDNERCSHL